MVWEYNWNMMGILMIVYLVVGFKHVLFSILYVCGMSSLPLTNKIQDDLK